MEEHIEEHILSIENTFHLHRDTFYHFGRLQVREHILSIENTFYPQRTHSIHTEHILSINNTFYLHREHILAFWL